MDTAETVENEFLPILRTYAEEMSREFPSLKFAVSSAPVGTLTPNPGHGIWLECLMGEVPRDLPDSVVLEIELSHLTTDPRIYADVVWNSPSGHIEAEAGEAMSTNDWPKLAQGGIETVREKLPDLLEAFRYAVSRGHPPDARTV